VIKLIFQKEDKWDWLQMFVSAAVCNSNFIQISSDTKILAIKVDSHIFTDITLQLLKDLVTDNNRKRTKDLVYVKVHTEEIDIKDIKCLESIKLINNDESINLLSWYEENKTVVFDRKLFSYMRTNKIIEIANKYCKKEISNHRRIDYLVLESVIKSTVLDKSVDE
jgi:hypothetical protein